MKRHLMTTSHDQFRSMVRSFIDREVLPNREQWDALGHPPREFFHKLGELGVLGMCIPEEYGGGGESSFAYNAIVFEEVARAGVSFGSFTVHSCVALPYVLEYATNEQKRQWLPGMSDGTLMTAIAMTEPGTGSDLAGISTRARITGDGTSYVVNGAKTFITGGAVADLIFVVCRTSTPVDGDRRQGLTMLGVPTDSDGFSVTRTLRKLGLHQQDTTELTFDDVVVPAENVLGTVGEAFSYLGHNLPQERLSIALNQVGFAEAAIEQARVYAQAREVFGKPVSTFQNTRFVLAECSTETQAARVYADHCLQLLDRKELSAADAARAKLFCSEVAGRVVDKCLQLHGGYGYIDDFPISRLYADTRVSRIYGGTSEIMKSIIAKDMEV